MSDNTVEISDQILTTLVKAADDRLEELLMFADEEYCEEVSVAIREARSVISNPSV